MTTTTKTRASSRRRPAESQTDLVQDLIAKGDRATAWAVEVVSGRVVQGPHVRNACRRHLDDLVHGPGRNLYWDLDRAKHAWHWFETVLKLSEGQFEGIPFLLHGSQAFRVGCIFGWKKAATGLRRFRRFYDEEGKGNGKSPLAAGIGLYMMTADGEAGAQIYAIGAKKEQAGILFADAVKMVKKAPRLAKRLKFSGGEGKEYNIAHHATASFMRPISKDAGKKGSGPRPHCGLADEVHEYPNRDAVEMVERGFKFRLQPLLAMFTNSGSDRNSYCYEEHEHGIRVVAGTRTPDAKFTYVGEIIDDDTFVFICALDPGDDPLSDPSCWCKANPLLGVILSEEYLAGVVAQAKAMPGKLNGILRLHFCVWTDSDEAWISRDTLEKVLADFDPAEHHGKKISLGLDLSGTRDLTALAAVVETGTKTMIREDGSEVELPTFDAWIEAWTPGETLAARALADSAPYEEWVRSGDLRSIDGPRVRFDHVAVHVAALDLDFIIKALAYDRYSYRQFQDELDNIGLDVLQVEHPQAGRKKGAAHEVQLKAAKMAKQPAPEGLWMPGSLLALEQAIIDERIRLKISPVLISACMSAATDKDALENRWLSKQKATQRIDPAVALCMAMGAALAPYLEPLKSIYESRGVRRL
jgi:phage terminase large subunit-like protein